MSQEFISLRDLQRIVLRNTRLIFMVMMLCLMAGYLAQKNLPHKFKSKAVLNIQSAYFQNALVGDLFPSLNDSAEQNAQRMSLLRYALNEKFVDGLAERYNVYKHQNDPAWRVMEREGFLKNIEYYSTSSNTFQISVIAGDGRSAYEMTNAVLDQMMRTLIDERRKNLQRIKKAVETHVQSLSVALKDVQSLVASLAPNSLKEELNKITEDIRALRSQYTDMHPDILRLEDRARAIRAVLARNAEQQKTVQTLVSPASRNATQEVYDDLVKKLNFLNVLTQMEGEGQNVSYLAVIEQPTIPAYPFFPPRIVVLMISVGVGMLLSAILVVYSELRLGTFLAPLNASEVLGVPLLGELPRLVSQTRVRLITGPGANAIRQLLPPPAMQE